MKGAVARRATRLFTNLLRQPWLPTEIVRKLKSITANKIFAAFPWLKKKYFWGSGLWSKGYYIGTAGNVSAETIRKYIEACFKKSRLFRAYMEIANKNGEEWWTIKMYSKNMVWKEPVWLKEQK